MSSSPIRPDDLSAQVQRMRQSVIWILATAGGSMLMYAALGAWLKLISLSLLAAAFEVAV